MSSIGFAKLFRRARHLGYVAGVSYQSVPFDFRLAMESNRVRRIFGPNLERLHKLTSKKVVIIAHSYGNNAVASELSRMPQRLKDSQLGAWVLLAPPLAGSTRPLSGVTGGNANMSRLDVFGLRFSSSVGMMKSFSAAYENFPRDVFWLERGQPWLAWVRRRFA